MLFSIVNLAKANRTTRISYHRMGHHQPASRIIEPYHLIQHGNALMVHAWQLEPTITDPCWKNFRLDRITEVTNGGQEFSPRCKVTIADTNVDQIIDVHVKRRNDPADRYRQFLLGAASNHRLSEDEMHRATDLARKLTESQIKLVHSQVYAEVLSDIVLDHQVSENEEHFLVNLRSFMQKLGWAP
jgi:predicted DNA-binding transcriptional regulator YafY